MHDPVRVRSGLVLAACFLSSLGWLPLRAGLAEQDERLRDTIDREVRKAWQREGVMPAAPAGDAEFLRRIYLDLTGRIPSYEAAAAFLVDPAADKREKLIDRLLDDPRYAVHQADVWDLVLFGRDPPGFYARERDGFQQWLRGQFASNAPYDAMVRRILMAEGDTAEHGAPMFLVQFDRHPEDAAVAVTRLFLGVQLECARCHDHPFEDYTQLDFYGMAAFFARLQAVEVGKLDKQKRMAIGEMNRGEILFSGPAAEQTPGKKGTAVPARFMRGEVLGEPELPEDFEEPRRFPNGKMPPAPRFSRKDALAEWIASVDNPYFARAAVNRVWAQFLGKGLVHPVDHLSETNPPSHPELLDALAAAFASHDFDLKWLIREIVSSRTYQLSGQGEIAEARPHWFERARFRPLSAEELFESWRMATGVDAGAEQSPGEDRFKVQGVTWDYVRRFFGTPTDGVGNFQGGMHEHLYLNNGQVHSLITRREGGLYHALSTSPESWEQRVERLYVQTLSRPPEPEEAARLAAYLSAGDDADKRLHDAIWSLITCSEFRFNH